MKLNKQTEHQINMFIKRHTFATISDIIRNTIGECLDLASAPSTQTISRILRRFDIKSFRSQRKHFYPKKQKGLDSGMQIKQEHELDG
jgi:hypothetical protein